MKEGIALIIQEENHTSLNYLYEKLNDINFLKKFNDIALNGYSVYNSGYNYLKFDSVTKELSVLNRDYHSHNTYAVFGKDLIIDVGSENHSDYYDPDYMLNCLNSTLNNKNSFLFFCDLNQDPLLDKKLEKILKGCLRSWAFNHSYMFSFYLHSDEYDMMNSHMYFNVIYNYLYISEDDISSVTQALEAATSIDLGFNRYDMNYHHLTSTLNEIFGGKINYETLKKFTKKVKGIC